MPYPVPPREPPLIVQPLPPEALNPVSTGSLAQCVTTKSWAPTPPLPLNAAKSAAILGSSVSVGYPVNPIETTNSTNGSAIAAPAAPPSSTQLLSAGGASSARATLVNRLLSAQERSQIPGDIVKAQEKAKEQGSRVAGEKESPPAPVPLCPPASSVTDTSKPNSQPGEFNLRFTVIEPQPAPPALTQQQRQLVQQPTPSPVPPQSQSQPSGPQPPNAPPVRERIVQLTSQRQAYDAQRQIVTAEGKVLLRFDGAVVNADRLQVNLQNLISVAEGNVVLTRGQQVLRGRRFTYNIIQDTGEILNGRGEVDLPRTSSDFSGNLPTDVSAGGVPPQLPSDSSTANQPVQQVSSPGGIGFTVGTGRNIRNLTQPQKGGTIRRLRFQSERIDFYPGGWQARNVRITNDPFSPPELELRSDTATLTRETPLRQRIVTTRPRLVFDQGTSLAIPRNQAVIDRNQRRDVSPTIAQVGYDGTDKSGLYVERGITPINTDLVRLSVAPQFLAQRAIQGSGGDVRSVFGLRTRLDGNLGPRTSLRGSANFNGFDSIENRLRANLRLRQTIGNRLPHTLTLESSYRTRFYNGSLGFQTVQSSVGGILTSSITPLGKSGINLSYQVGAQDINANTDRASLLAPVRRNDRVSLGRFQGSAALSTVFGLWQGKGLPATATQGLRYTPAPVVPNLLAYTGVTGVAGYYTNGDSQDSLTGTIGLQGQLGHFSRPFLDYTSFNVSFSQGLRTGTSPFLFDRFADTTVLNAELTQQIYGPIRVGFRTSINLNTGQRYSTDYILEYSRRSYGITLRYNPNLQLGSLSLRISDFNWSGGSDTFSGAEFQPVLNGVPRDND